MVEDKTKVPEVTTKSNCITWRVMPMKRIHDNSLTYDTDGCRCWQTTTLGATYKNWFVNLTAKKADHRTDIKQIESSLWKVEYPISEELETLKTSLTEQEVTYTTETRTVTSGEESTAIETLYLTFESTQTARELCNNLGFSNLSKIGVYPTY